MRSATQVAFFIYLRLPYYRFRSESPSRTDQTMRVKIPFMKTFLPVPRYRTGLKFSLYLLDFFTTSLVFPFCSGLHLRLVSPGSGSRMTDGGTGFRGAW